MNGVVLDTCVVSEPKRPNPDPQVLAWLDAYPPDKAYLTATVVAEIAEGIERLPAGRRRAALELWLEETVLVFFAGRILPFDTEAARHYGRLATMCGQNGRMAAIADAQIAAVARRHGMAVATRNLRDFEAFGIPLVNPWDGPGGGA